MPNVTPAPPTGQGAPPSFSAFARLEAQNDGAGRTPEEEAFFDRFLWAAARAGIGPWRLAQLLGTSPATTHSWFRRRSLPGGRHMIRLPEILGVNGHWLLTGKGRP